MTKAEKVKKRFELQCKVAAARLRRWLRKLDTDELLSMYEEGSNLFFHGAGLTEKAHGSMLLDAAVSELQDRFPAARELDLSHAFPLRSWINGVPQS